jgi:hypothetical protein
MKVLAIVGAIASFLWAVYQWRASQNELREQRAYEITKTSEQRRIEAQKPFLDRQLVLYTETIHLTSFLATAAQSPEWTKARDRFWELYWGELATVENREVASQMVSFGEALNGQGGKVSDAILQQKALSLAHAVRESLDQSWGIKVWTSNQ